MSASGVTLEPARIAADLRSLATEIGRMETLIEEVMPVHAFRLRELRFLVDNLAHMVTQACREYERSPDEPPFYVEHQADWFAEHLSIMEPSY